MDSTIFVGRQPIFDRREKVFGYELLYRANAQQNAYAHTDGDRASTNVINGSLNTIGISELVGTKRAFVNITRQLLLHEDYTVLPKDLSVIELLETVEPDDEVIAACRTLKEAGYMLALDDFVFSPKYAPLVECADILKIDFLASNTQKRQEAVEKFGGDRIMLLAEKVETRDDFAAAVAMGYTYFQGYFFCKPEIIVGKEIPALKHNYLLFIQEVNRPEINFNQLEMVVKHEVSLSSKLLRYLNSASMGLTSRITSIHQALTMLGDRPLRKWASLVAVGALGEDKPMELLLTCLVRARFCEMIGPEVGIKNRELDMFLMGLFSAMDVLVNQPLGDIISQMPVPPDIAAALLGANTLLGRAFGLALAIERGNTTLLESKASRFNISVERVSEIYRHALLWADESVGAAT